MTPLNIKNSKLNQKTLFSPSNRKNNKNIIPLFTSPIFLKQRYLSKQNKNFFLFNPTFETIFNNKKNTLQYLRSKMTNFRINKHGKLSRSLGKNNFIQLQSRNKEKHLSNWIYKYIPKLNKYHKDIKFNNENIILINQQNKLNKTISNNKKIFNLLKKKPKIYSKIYDIFKNYIKYSNYKIIQKLDYKHKLAAKLTLYKFKKLDIQSKNKNVNIMRWLLYLNNKKKNNLKAILRKKLKSLNNQKNILMLTLRISLLNKMVVLKNENKILTKKLNLINQSNFSSTQTKDVNFAPASIAFGLNSVEENVLSNIYPKFNSEFKNLKSIANNLFPKSKLKTLLIDKKPIKNLPFFVSNAKSQFQWEPSIKWKEIDKKQNLTLLEVASKRLNKKIINDKINIKLFLFYLLKFDNHILFLFNYKIRSKDKFNKIKFNLFNILDLTRTKKNKLYNFNNFFVLYHLFSSEIGNLFTLSSAEHRKKNIEDKKDNALPKQNLNYIRLNSFIQTQRKKMIKYNLKKKINYYFIYNKINTSYNINNMVNLINYFENNKFINKINLLRNSNINLLSPLDLANFVGSVSNTSLYDLPAKNKQGGAEPRFLSGEAGQNKLFNYFTLFNSDLILSNKLDSKLILNNIEAKLLTIINLLGLDDFNFKNFLINKFNYSSIQNLSYTSTSLAKVNILPKNLENHNFINVKNDLFNKLLQIWRKNKSSFSSSNKKFETVSGLTKKVKLSRSIKKKIKTINFWNTQFNFISGVALSPFPSILYNQILLNSQKSDASLASLGGDEIKGKTLPVIYGKGKEENKLSKQIKKLNLFFSTYPDKNRNFNINNLLFTKENKIKIADTINNMIKKNNIFIIKNFKQSISNISPVNILYYFGLSNNSSILSRDVGQNKNKNKSIKLTYRSPMIYQYLKAMSIYNMKFKGTFVYYSNIIAYNFNYKNNKLTKNIYKLLYLTFKSMLCLISKPVFIFKGDKIVIQLFYFLLIPNFLKKKKFKKSKFFKNIVFNKKFLNNYESYKNFKLNKKKNIFLSYLSPLRKRKRIAMERLQKNGAALPPSASASASASASEADKKTVIIGPRSNQTSKLNKDLLMKLNRSNTRIINSIKSKINNKFVKLRKNKFSIYDYKLNFYQMKILTKFKNLNIRKKIKLRRLSNISLIKLYPIKFKILCNILSNLFKKNIELDLIRLHYPYNNSQILVSLLAFMVNKIKIRRITRKIFRRAIIRSLKNSFNRNKITLLPSFLTGLTIKFAGRLMNYRQVPKRTVKLVQRGSSSIGTVNYTDFARYTSKNRRGAYSITVSSGQNYF